MSDGITQSLFSPLNLLIVDDSDDFRVLARHLLLSRYPDAQITELGECLSAEAQTTLRNPKFQLILLDYQLGESNGLDILRELTRNACPATVLFITAHGSEKLAVAAIKGGAFDFISKIDFTPNAFLDSVANALVYYQERQIAQQSPNSAPKVEFGTSIAISGYHPIRHLGRGGWASVYLAERLKDHQQIVLKLLFAENADAEQSKRFEQEYAMLCALVHNNIVKAYDYGITESCHYMALEYLAGDSLQVRLRQGSLAEREAIEFTAQLASALFAMHTTGIVHRDIKPGNIIFRDAQTPVFIDFGASRNVVQSLDLTMQQQVIGTLAYMSPEQIMGKKVGSMSDIYSLGCMLYMMLTGHKPYRGVTPSEVANQHINSPVPQLPAQFAHLQEFIDISMAKQPNQRYFTAGHFEKALRKVL